MHQPRMESACREYKVHFCHSNLVYLEASFLSLLIIVYAESYKLLELFGA